MQNKFCVDKKSSSKKTAKKPPAKTQNKYSVKKPRGRPPKGKKWDYDKGEWVDL